MTPEPLVWVPVNHYIYLLRCNGALVAVFSTESKAIDYMKTNRKNSEFWRIEKKELL